MQVVEPGPGVADVRTGQPDQWVNLHHQVAPQARLPGEAGLHQANEESPSW